MFKGISKEQEQLWLSKFESISLPSSASGNGEGKGVTTKPFSTKNENVETSRNGTIGIPYIHEYVNTNDTDCAQAAITTLACYHGKNIYPSIPRNIHDAHDNRYYADNYSLVEAVFHDFPNDGVFFGAKWTWKEQVANGLRGCGLNNVDIGYAGAGENGQEQWNTVFSWLSNGWPVVVLIDINPIFNKWGYHYPVLYKFDGTYVYLSNMGVHYQVDFNTFVEAWHCSSAPYPNNFVYVVCSR